MARLYRVVEDALASPYYDTGETVEQAQPWMRQAWEFATRSGRFAGQQYEFSIEVGDDGSWVHSACRGDRIALLKPCSIYTMSIDRKYLGDTSQLRFQPIWIIAHEFAHLLAQSSAVPLDASSEPNDELNALALLHFTTEYDCGDVPATELMVDSVALAAFPSSPPTYWDNCGRKTAPATALAVAQSLLDGEHSPWFIDTYGLPDGGFALQRLWADYRAVGADQSTYWNFLWAWQMQDAFGSGYCDNGDVADVVYFDRGGVVNPWSSGDDDRAGCS